MTIAILADNVLKNEFLSKAGGTRDEIIWADSLRSLAIIEADLYFDLQFTMDRERIAVLKKLLPAPVLVNAVAYTTKEMGHDFIRINAWPTMLQRDMVEIALAHPEQEQLLQLFFEQLHWTILFVPDVPGMVTPRILAMIVNEAYYTLGDEVSTKEEIDIAMQLGTNYPMGPFAWSKLIGLHKIYELLNVLSLSDKRYSVAPALLAELDK